MSALKNEIGNRYGRLVVVERGPNDKQNKASWVCQCDCGNKTTVTGYSLRGGITKSCGCLSNELSSERLFIDETDNKYGKLTVISRAENNIHGQAMWNCVCDCGNKTIVPGIVLRRNLTRSCGCVLSHGEETIQNILQKFNVSYERQYQFSDLKSKNNKNLRFDFAIFKNNKLSHLIEYDGPQHYQKSNSWYNETIVYHDNLKNQYCKQNNIELRRFRDYKNLTIQDLI